jgi:hypothetical protein
MSSDIQQIAHQDGVKQFSMNYIMTYFNKYIPKIRDCKVHSTEKEKNIEKQIKASEKNN